MEKFCFGVDIGGTTVKMGLFDENAKLYEKWEIKTRVEEGGKHILPDIAASITDKMKEKELNREQMTGVGVGVPAPVNADGSVTSTANLGWGHVELVKELEQMTGISVKAGNDANVAALGETWKGGGEGYHNLVMVTLGTGVGGGIILNGKIWNGTNGAAGEIGHIHVEDEEEDYCGCGNQGCLEQYASATGIVRLCNRKLSESNMDSVLRGKNISAKAVFDAVKEKDALAILVAKQFGKYLGTALASIAAVVDPEVFVIGGGVSKAGQVLFDYIRPAYDKAAFSACRQVEFKLASLGNDAGIYGAAKLALSKE